MAYLEKYYISYCDDFNTSRRVSLLLKDYQGATNVISDSDDITGGAWTNTQLTITAPTIVATSINNVHWITQTVTKAASAESYTASVTVAANGYSRVYLRVSSGSSGVIVYFNISTNTFYNLQELGDYVSVSNESVNNGDGTFALTIRVTTDTATDLTIAIGIVNDSDAFVFFGDNVSGIDISNPQLTAGNSSTELLADVNPIAISYESSEDFKFSPIRPSAAEVFMIFGGADGVDFEEFWTADEKDWKVQDIKAGVVEWSGYVIPNGFQYEFKGGLYHASISASDGLGTLESLTFVDDNLKPYGNQDLAHNNGFEFPFSLIITEILKKLELDLDLWTCIDSYERSMLKVGDVREADPLSASFVNVKTYIETGENKNIPYWYGSGEEWNCKDVLENVLYIFGAKLYQEFGVWRVKSINADIDYGTGATQRYWRKYNTAGTYLFDYETVNDEILIPCGDSTKYMVGNDHVMSMDDVYKAFRMNYEYTFLRDGDSPINLLTNSGFCDFDDNSVISAPTGWARVKENNNDLYIRLRSVSVSNPNDVGGFTCAVELGKQKTGTSLTGTKPQFYPDSGLISIPPKTIKQNDRVFLDLWVKYKNRISVTISTKLYNGNSTMMYRMVVVDFDGTEKYFLRNGPLDVDEGFVWEKSSSSNGDIFENTTCFYMLADTASNYDSVNDSTNFWYNHKHKLPNCPISGYVYFMYQGLAYNFGIRGSNNFDWPAYVLKSGIYRKANYWLTLEQTPDTNSELVYPRITGAFLGIIPSGEDLPEQQDYIYNNTNTNYTLQVDPITIYNGDTQDVKHISNIIVPTNTSGGKNFWDDLGDTYGTSSLGLLTVREIMRQYAKPYRILEGTVKIQDARFGSVYTFETIPDVRFILQRGTFNKQKQYIEDGTFVQLTSDVLPNGGSEGGNNLTPLWIETGNSYCQVGEDALNTGFVIVEEQDINPNSETYQETREIVSDAQDLESCPLLTPRLYYWGTDDVYLNTFTLDFSPFIEVNSKEIQISFDNNDGNYLYFVHLKSLGSVERIYTLTSPNNVLSDWVYLADVIIDGYIYRVLRTDYVMTEFTGFTHNFKFT